MVTINCIGAGHWGPNLIRNFAVHPEVTVRSVCDVSEKRLDLVRSRIPGIDRFETDPIATATDPEADGIVIATPVSTHYELCKHALEAGKHVLVEKPLCGSSREGEELVEIARSVGKHLCVGHVFLFNNGIRAVRNLIRSGELGPIRYIFATRTNLGPIRRDVNALWDLAAHDLSIFNYWMEDVPFEVTAHGAAYLNAEVEDVVIANYRYSNDVLAHVHASWLNPRKVREITVVGEQKMAVWNDMDLNEPVRVYDKAIHVEREPMYSDSFGEFRMHVHNGDVQIPHIAGAEPLAEECRHFIDCILDRATPINTGFDALSVLYALEGADASISDGSRTTAIGPILDAETGTPSKVVMSNSDNS